jgi:hypothetical protein
MTLQGCPVEASDGRVGTAKDFLGSVTVCHIEP